MLKNELYKMFLIISLLNVLIIYSDINKNNKNISFLISPRNETKKLNLNNLNLQKNDLINIYNLNQQKSNLHLTINNKNDEKIKTQTTIFISERTIKTPQTKEEKPVKAIQKIDLSLSIKNDKIIKTIPTDKDKQYINNTNYENKKIKKTNDLYECIRCSFWTLCCCGCCGLCPLVH
jgi:hypothetical protein